MQKILPTQKVERFSEHRIAPEVAELRQRIESQMIDAGSRIRDAYEALPPLPFLRDRQEEIWSLCSRHSVVSTLPAWKNCANAL